MKLDFFTSGKGGELKDETVGKSTKPTYCRGIGNVLGTVYGGDGFVVPAED